MTDYGEDFAGAGDVDANLTTAGGNLGLLYAIARRLMTPRGAYPHDEEYGTDIRAQVGASKRGDVVASWIEAEAYKDERVRACTATVTRERLGPHASERLVVGLRIVGAQGPFDGTLAVSDLTVEVVRDLVNTP